MKTVSLKKAAMQVHVPYPTAARWVQHRLIRPREYVGRQGVRICLDAKAMRELRVLTRLRGLLSLQQLKRAMRYLRDDLKHNPLSTGRFFVVGGPPMRRKVIKICDNGEAIEIIGKNQGQLMVPLLFDGVESSK